MPTRGPAQQCFACASDGRVATASASENSALHARSPPPLPHPKQKPYNLILRIMSKPESSKHLTTAVTEAEKADKIVIWSFAAPHMRAFHLAWFGFFIVSVGKGRGLGIRWGNGVDDLSSDSHGSTSTLISFPCTFLYIFAPRRPSTHGSPSPPLCPS